MIRIIISDEFGQHGIDIRTAISIGYGSDISDQIQIIGGWTPAFEEARDNNDIVALIRSTGGVAGFVTAATQLYPRVQTFFPLGSNNFLRLTTPSDKSVIITAGAGDAEMRNNTGYGPGLDFWDLDLEDIVPDDHSSFSNGIILGKMLYIKDQLSSGWWEARYKARVEADQDEPNRPPATPWHEKNGYGKINVSAAIASGATEPADPYSPVLGSIGSITAEILGDVVTFQFDSVLNANQYEVRIDGGAIVYQGSVLTGQHLLTSYGDFDFDYRANNTNVPSSTAWSTSVPITFNVATDRNLTGIFIDKTHVYLQIEAFPEDVTYNIYRDTVLIDNITEVTYIDVVVGAGPFEYTIEALSAGATVLATGAVTVSSTANHDMTIMQPRAEALECAINRLTSKLSYAKRSFMTLDRHNQYLLIKDRAIQEVQLSLISIQEDLFEIQNPT